MQPRTQAISFKQVISTAPPSTSCQVTNFFCSRCGCASASSARSRCYLGLHASVAISVLREVSFNAVLADTTFPRGSEPDSREEPAGASRCSGTLSSTRVSVNSSNLSGRSRNGFAHTVPLSFLFRLWFSSGSRYGSLRTLSLLLVLSLLVAAGCCVRATASCSNDVGDVRAAEPEEPVDKPGTTIGT